MVADNDNIIWRYFCHKKRTFCCCPRFEMFVQLCIPIMILFYFRDCNAIAKPSQPELKTCGTGRQKSKKKKKNVPI